MTLQRQNHHFSSRILNPETGTSPSHHVYKPLFKDNDDGEGSLIGPRSILRVQVEREEVPWCDICFKSKAQCHQSFYKWARRIMAKPSVTKLFNKLGIRQALTQSRTISIDKIKSTWSFWFLGRARRPTLLWPLGRICASLEYVAVLTSLPLFGDAHATRVTLEGEDQKRLDFLNKALSTRVTLATRLPTCPRPSSSRKAREGIACSRQRLAWPIGYLFLCFRVASRMGYTAMFFFLLSCSLQERGWLSHPSNQVLYTLGLTSVCGTSSARLVDTTLSRMLTHPFFRCFSGRDLALYPQIG